MQGQAHRIALYQDRCHNMVAKPGTNLKTMPKRRSGKGSCTKPAHNPLRGSLRKRLARLHDRQHGMMGVVNEPGYRRPGSMTK